MEIEVLQENQIDVAKTLFKAYEQWIAIDLSFQNFDNELNSLPGCYSAPEGAIILAKEANQYIACVAFRPLTKTRAELKRMFISDAYRGLGYSKLLLEQAISVAGKVGYKSLVLDTLPNMKAAKSLYCKYGFKPIDPYYDSPIEGTEYYEYLYRQQVSDK